MGNDKVPNGKPAKDADRKDDQGAGDQDVKPPTSSHPSNPLQDVPTETQSFIQQAIAMFSGPMRSPFWESFRPEHMTTFLQGQDEESKRAHEDRQRDRIFQGFLYVVSLIFVLVLVAIAVFGNVMEILPTIVVGILSFGAGVAAGTRVRR